MYGSEKHCVPLGTDRRSGYVCGEYSGSGTFPERPDRTRSVPLKALNANVEDKSGSALLPAMQSNTYRPGNPPLFLTSLLTVIAENFSL